MTFNEMPFGNELLLAMYNTPSRELPIEQIATILSNKTGKNIDVSMIAPIYKTLGASLGQDLDLRKRNRIAKVETEPKVKRTTKKDVLNELFGTLGIIPDPAQPTVDEVPSTEKPDWIENENVDTGTPDVDEADTVYTPEVSYNGVEYNTFN